MRVKFLVTTLMLVAGQLYTQDSFGQTPLRYKDNPELQIRRTKLINIYHILNSIDSAEENLRVFADTKLEQLRAKFPVWQEDVKKGREKLGEFEQLFKKDPSLLNHARLVLTEARRLEKIDMKVGTNYFTSEDALLQRVKKLEEYIDSINRLPDVPGPKK